jgi:hypothetical protein
MAARIAHNMTDEVNHEAATHENKKRGPTSTHSSDRADLDNLDSQLISDNPAILCEMVRSVARRAYSVMRQPSQGTEFGPLPEIVDLLNHIDRLQLCIEDFRTHRPSMLEGLQLWLDSLRRQVEALMPERQRGARE